MKNNKNKIEKSTIELLREIRDKISAETQNMTFEQLQKYINHRLSETLHAKVNWQKENKVYK